MSTEDTEAVAAPSPSEGRAPELAPLLRSFLSESVTLLDRDGELRARIGPPDGVLGYGTGIEAIIEAAHPDDVVAITEIVAAVADSEPEWSGRGRVRLRHADGSWRPYEVRAWNQHGIEPLDGFVVSLREVLDGDVPLIVAGAEVEALNLTLTAAQAVATLVVDRDLVVRYVSPLAETKLHRTVEELRGRDLLADVVAPADRHHVRGAIEGLAPREQRTVVCRLQRPGEPELVAEVRLVAGSRDPVSAVTLVLVDRSGDQELVRLATTDSLTGLANRMRLNDTLEGLLATGTPLSVVYIDVDGLKPTNDTYGHLVGDEVLVELTRQISEIVGDERLTARIGGDEFVIVCTRCEPGATDDLVRRLREEVRVVPVEGAEPVTLSVGVTRSRPGDTPASVLDRADAAMYVDKGRSGPALP